MINKTTVVSTVVGFMVAAYLWESYVRQMVIK